LGGPARDGAGGADGAGRVAGRHRALAALRGADPALRALDRAVPADVMAAGGHPSDADRETAARPVLDAALAASAARDREALAACYAEDVVWLHAGGVAQGRD